MDRFSWQKRKSKLLLTADAKQAEKYPPEESQTRDKEVHTHFKVFKTSMSTQSKGHLIYQIETRVTV